MYVIVVSESKTYVNLLIVNLNYFNGGYNNDDENIGR
jgi:hypothetical protein